MINHILLFLSVSLETGKNAAFECFGKKKESGGVDLDLFNTITYISAVPVLLLFFIFGKSHTCSLFTLVTAVGFASVNILAQLCYIKAISRGSMTCTTLISCCGFLISTVFSVVCYSENVRLIQIILLPLLILSLALTMDLKRGNVDPEWILYAFGSMLFTGLIGVMQKIHQESGHGDEMSLFLLISFVIMAAISGMLLTRAGKPSAKRYSGPQLQTTTQKNIVKMEIDEIRESRRIRKWKAGFGEETETSRGWLSHRLFLPLGGAVSSSRAQATQKLRMMIRTPDPVSDNQDSDAVGLNYTARHSRGSRRVAPSETRSRLCK